MDGPMRNSMGDVEMEGDLINENPVDLLALEESLRCR